MLKGYTYFAMGFSVFVEMLNIRLRKTRAVRLHQRLDYTGLVEETERGARAGP